MCIPARCASHRGHHRWMRTFARCSRILARITVMAMLPMSRTQPSRSCCTWTRSRAPKARGICACFRASAPNPFIRTCSSSPSPRRACEPGSSTRLARNKSSSSARRTRQEGIPSRLYQITSSTSRGQGPRGLPHSRAQSQCCRYRGVPAGDSRDLNVCGNLFECTLCGLRGEPCRAHLSRGRHGGLPIAGMARIGASNAANSSASDCAATMHLSLMAPKEGTPAYLPHRRGERQGVPNPLAVTL